VNHYWFHESFFRAFGETDKGNALTTIINTCEARSTRQADTFSVPLGQGLDVEAALLRGRETFAILHCSALPPPNSVAGRSLFVAASVLDDTLDSQDFEAQYDRYCDVSDIDRTASRAGLRHQKEGQVRSIFVAGGYRRLHFVTPTEGLAVVLGAFKADLWASHTASKQVHRPAPSDIEFAIQVNQQAVQLRQRPRATPAPAPVLPAAPLRDGWVTLNRLIELKITDPMAQRQVLAVDSVDSLYELIGSIQDDAIETLETCWKLKTQRQAEKKIDLIELVNTNVFAPSGRSAASSLGAALAILTPKQRDVVTLEIPSPIRVRGGPGTGKTFTAVMRAGWVLSRAEEAGRPCRVGFFVFNRELGEKVVEDFKRLGLDGFFETSANPKPQRLLVTSLLDWGERFIDLESLGVEPLAPYRADNVDKHRQAALELAIEEARRLLGGEGYQELWGMFDARSKHGLREIEMEISQFIKARDLTDLQSYMSERRPKGWWLAEAEKPFKKFIWEVAKFYDRTLHALGFIDADDVVNDCMKEVSKNVWQQYKKSSEGFDYLVVDEAQDFFRNQLSLVTQLVKQPTGLMISYDEAQAVYSRYPSLRDLGFDTDTSFIGKNLEHNFRSTRQIVSALRALLAKYPTVAVHSNWGNYDVSPDAADGPMPVGSGFSTEQAMFRQVADLLAEQEKNEVATSECALVVFDSVQRVRLCEFLENGGVKVNDVCGQHRRRSARAVFVADPKRVKGQQFELCILVGVGRDQLPDLNGTKTEVQRQSRREDELRDLIVAMSRARTHLHFLWHGSEPSEFITAMSATIEFKA